jgi:hypothetical protein
MTTKICAATMCSMIALSGCASIVDGSTQVLSVKTVESANEVSGANCSLTNEKGTWFVNTPGTVSVHRASSDLNIKCSKEGYEAAIKTEQSSTKSMAFGNILFGGVIGAGTDMATGAAYDYPQLITVPLTLKGTGAKQPEVTATDEKTTPSS